MSRLDKLLYSILCGTQDANIKFADLVHILTVCGFRERIRGDHHIFTKKDVAEILNLQPLGNQAKPYQVKQVRALILKYRLEEIIRAESL